MTGAASLYDRIRAACCDESALAPTTGGVDRHAAAIAETVLLAQSKVPLDVVLAMRERRLATSMGRSS